MNIRSVCELATLASIALAASAALAAAPAKKAAAPRDPKALYKANCAQCHGLDGSGNGPESAKLIPRPRNFAEGDFKIRSTAAGDLPTDEDLDRVIKRGMPGTAMPAYEGRFTEAEIRGLRDVVKSFSPRFDVDGPGAVVAVGSSRGSSPQAIAEGAKLFQKLGCVGCHGKNADGTGARAAGLTDADGMPAKPRDLRKRATYKGGAKPEDIARTLATGLDGSPMHAVHGVTDDQRWPLVWWLRSISK